MNVDLITVPYDSGHRALRMGRGPVHLLEYGIIGELERDEHDVRLIELESTVDLPTEIAVAFDLAREIGDAVRSARADGRFPLILAGNCFAAVGAIAGLGAEGTAVLWLDAHGDLNTPDTTRSGFLDGMAASVLTGRSWRELAAAVPGFHPLRDHRLALIGARDLDPAEQALAAAVGITTVAPDDVRRKGSAAVLGPLVARLSAGSDRFYLHVDLDVLDPEQARANGFAAPGGLSVRDVVEVAAIAGGAAGVAAASLTAFDPAYDQRGEAAAAAVEIARAVLRHAGRARAPSPAAPEA